MEEAAFITQETSEFNVIFIHYKLDDIGLTANQFRIYAHLARRAHSAGKAWPGIDSIATVCKMHKETVIEALRQLEEMKMILVERSPGKRSVYRLTQPSKWLPVGNGERLDQSEMGNGPVGNGERHQSEMGNVRLTSKDEQKKRANLLLASQAELVYQEYPRKVGKKAALPKIVKAIKEVGYTKLLYTVMAYANSRNGKPSKFTPHPATWFEQGRWDDEPETASTRKSTAPAAPGKW